MDLGCTSSSRINPSAKRAKDGQSRGVSTKLGEEDESGRKIKESKLMKNIEER